MKPADQIMLSGPYRRGETLYAGRLAKRLGLDRDLVSGTMRNMVEQKTLVKDGWGFKAPSVHWINKVRLNDPKAIRAARAA